MVQREELIGQDSTGACKGLLCNAGPSCSVIPGDLDRSYRDLASLSRDCQIPVSLGLFSCAGKFLQRRIFWSPRYQPVVGEGKGNPRRFSLSILLCPQLCLRSLSVDLPVQNLESKLPVLCQVGGRMPGCQSWGLTLFLMHVLCRSFYLQSYPTTHLPRQLVIRSIHLRLTTAGLFPRQKENTREGAQTGQRGCRGDLISPQSFHLS